MQRRVAGLLLSAVRAKDIDRQRRAPGRSSAAARGRCTALSSKCGQRHVNSRINEAEHRLGLLSILGLLKLQQYSLLVWNLCPDGNMHGIIYIDTLGGLDLDGSTDKNLPYFVMENLATLIQPVKNLGWLWGWVRC